MPVKATAIVPMVTNRISTGFLMVLFQMRMPASMSKATTTGRTPKKNLLSHSNWRPCNKSHATIKMTMKEGRMVPKEATIAPINFLWRKPIKMAVLMAKAPGRELTTANISMNSLFFIQCFWSTTACSTNGSIANPPPNVNRPIRKKMINKSHSLQLIVGSSGSSNSSLFCDTSVVLADSDNDFFRFILPSRDSRLWECLKNSR